MTRGYRGFETNEISILPQNCFASFEAKSLWLWCRRFYEKFSLLLYDARSLHLQKPWTYNAYHGSLDQFPFKRVCSS